MKKIRSTVVICAIFVLWTAISVSAAETARPQVRFSEWVQTNSGDSINTYEREIDVSDGGNYLMTYREHTASDTYYFYYDVIYQGKGIQKAYTKSLSGMEFEPGKLFPFESIDECDMDIDQMISDHIRLQASEESSFILVFRPHGGEYDGTIQTVRAQNGIADLTSSSFKETTSVDLLGVFRFPQDQREDLMIGPNVIQHDSVSFVIQQAFYSESSDGIGLITYTNSSGNDVCITQVIYDGFSVLKAYDKADTAQNIKTGRFAVLAFSHNFTDADFIN